MASEAELLEIKKIGEDVNAAISGFEGKLKEKADTADLEKQIKSIEESYKALEEKHKKQGESMSELIVKMNRDQLPFGGNREEATKNLESQIFEQLKAGQEKGIFKKENESGKKIFSLKDGHRSLHQKAVGIITTGNLTDGASGQGYSAIDIRSNVITSPAPAVRVRNLLNSSVMREAILQYPQFTGGEGSPNYQVNQGDTKAQIDYDFKMVTLEPKILAAFAVVSKKSLNDISWLANFFSTQMMLDLLSKEDYELLNGTGTDSIKGLIPSATTYTPTEAAYNTIHEYMVDMIAQLESTNYTANGIVLNPLDYAKLLIYKTTTGEFNYPGLVFGGSQRNLLTFNGTPIYKISQMPRGTTLVGDWTRAEMLIREGIQFDISYEDGDNFKKNLVTLRIEEEVDLAVYHPQAFKKADLTALSGI